MSEESKFLTYINRLPVNTILKRRTYYQDTLIWEGKIIRKGEPDITAQDPNLGTVIENLLLLKRRREQENLYGGEE